MSDTSDVVAVAPLCLTKLYQLNEVNNYVKFLEPDLGIKMLTEQTLLDEYPRQDKDADHTRIFVNYTNPNGQSLVFCVSDNLRLNNTFNIDTFFNKLFADINEGETDESTLFAKIGPSAVIMLNTAVSQALELESKSSLPVKRLGEVVLKASVSILLDDPLDAILFLKDNDDGEVQITNMWTVCRR